MAGSLIVKPARPGVCVLWPRPESHRILKPEGERVPNSPYWRRLILKGELMMLDRHPTESGPPAAAKAKE